MSHDDVHVLPDPDVPVSQGVPTSARLLMAGALLIIAIQGMFVVMASVFGRVWPAADSVRVNLP